MKTDIYAFTVAIGPSINIDVTKRLAARFERINNIPLHIIDDSILKDIKIPALQFARYAIWQVIPKTVKLVLSVDNDMLAVSPLPEPPDCDFGIASDTKAAFESFKNRWAAIADAGTYYNAGLFIASRKTESLFEQLLTESSIELKDWPWYFDQTLLNLHLQFAVKQKTLKVVQLSKQWNSLVLLDDDQPKDPYILHLASMPTRQSTWLLNAILNVLDQADKLTQPIAQLMEAKNMLDKLLQQTGSTSK